MNKYIGIPFKDGEPSFSGANCITLIELIYRLELGKEISKIRVPSEHSRMAFMQYMKEISEKWVEVDTPKEFTVVAMAHDMNHPKIVQHFGIYLGNGKILHTLNKIGSHVTNFDVMKPFIRGYYEWRS